ncbi:hypothetical protein BGZ46_001829 [Entomortierella lignicola]|nr:hypothetical protein BGZ46_001829 [Entomortierella lignicola]
MVIATLAAASTVAAHNAPEVVANVPAVGTADAAVDKTMIPKVAPIDKAAVPEAPEATPVVFDTMAEKQPIHRDDALWGKKRKPHHDHDKHHRKNGKGHSKHKKCRVSYVTVTVPNDECHKDHHFP